MGRVSVSHTTRPSRGDEVDGKHYNYVSDSEFRELIASGRMLEHAEVHGSLYGTSADWLGRTVSSGVNVFLDIDVQGTRLLKDRLEGVTTVFILPPSYDELKRRLRSRRRESDDEIDERLRHGLSELMALGEFDYVLVNEDLEGACEASAAIVDDVAGRSPGAAASLRSAAQGDLVSGWLEIARDGVK